MLARKQNIAQSAEVAVSQLQIEARYFDQLAGQFPVYKRSLGKHAVDCRHVAKNIRKKFKHDSLEVLSKSACMANVFLTEGRRLRLKLRINLLQQEATGLELEAGRWPVLEDEFKTLAEECRQQVSLCQTNISSGSSSEIEESLTKATAFYEKSINLRKQQKQERREDASRRLHQKIMLLKDQADHIQGKIKTHPSLSGRYTELAALCLQAVVQLEEKTEQASMNEIEKAISATAHFIDRVKLSRVKAEPSDRETQADNVVPIRNSYSTEPELVDTDALQNAQSEPEVFLPVPAQIEYEVILDKTERAFQLPWLHTGIKQIFGVLMPILSLLSSLLTNVFTKLVKFTERIFMLLVAGLVVLVIVFVVTYLSGSGFSSIGLL